MSSFRIKGVTSGQYQFFEFTFTQLDLANALAQQHAKPGLLGSGRGLSCRDLFDRRRVRSFRVEIPTFVDVEAMGKDLRREFSLKRAERFVEAVVMWGRGFRVYPAIEQSRRSIAREIRKLMPVLSVIPQEAALDQLVSSAHGLGISYASKLLRMLDPKRFPVLDDVLESQLGVAKSISGYKLLSGELQRFVTRHRRMRAGRLLGLGELESAIYYMVREQARSVRQESRRRVLP